MDFDIHLQISETSPCGQVIQMLAKKNHIAPVQAAERLLEEAAQLHVPIKENPTTVDPEYLRELAIRSKMKAEARRMQGDMMASIRPESPDALIGYLGDFPEVAKTIRDIAEERRANTYGV